MEHEFSYYNEVLLKSCCIFRHKTIFAVTSLLNMKDHVQYLLDIIHPNDIVFAKDLWINKTDNYIKEFTRQFINRLKVISRWVDVCYKM
jgi:hypothetical protein